MSDPAESFDPEKKNPVTPVVPGAAANEDTIDKATAKLSPVRSASSLLPTITPQVSALVDNNFVPSPTWGSTTDYARGADGSNLGQRDFAHLYMMATRKVLNRAREILAANPSQQELQEQRRAILKASSAIVPDTGGSHLSHDDLESLQESYDASCRQAIARLATASTHDDDLQFRALSLALLITRKAEAQAQTREAMAHGGAQKLADYSMLMERARADAGEMAPLEKVVTSYMRIARELFGYTPKLHVITDFDGSLINTFDCGSQWKPGEQTNQLLNEVDRLAGLPPYMRLVMTESPGADAARNFLAKSLYNAAAQEVTLFTDVPNLSLSIENAGAANIIVSSNHRNLVQSVVKSAGVAAEVIAPSDSYHFDAKVDVVLSKILAEERLGLFIVVDNNDLSLAANIVAKTSPILGHTVDLAKVAIFGIQVPQGPKEQAGVVARALLAREIPHAVNRRDEHGQGQQATLRLVSTYLFNRPWKQADFDWKISLPMGATGYQTGDIVETCRHRVKFAPGFPASTSKTILRPVHNVSLTGNNQYDIGVPTAHLLRGTGNWLLLYKAASAPSGAGNLTKACPSNVFGGVFSPNSNQILYLDPKNGPAKESVGVSEFVKSSLGPELARDGLHDPRLTWIPSLNMGLMLANAFNKVEEQASMNQAAGDISKPIRGAVTELFAVRGDPTIAENYISLGQFGPDFHFKNMVFFPETIRIDGEEHLLVLGRKMPGIQAFPIPMSAIEGSLSLSADERTNFWNDLLAPDNLKKYEVMKPELLHEGFGNPNAPARAGQIAPGMAPIKVELPGKEGKEVYWLLIYNAVPDFKGDKKGSAHGRVICGALLDYHNPWEVVARSPLPLIVPRNKNEFVAQENGLHPRHDDVAFTGGGGVDEQGALNVFLTEQDTVVRLERFPSVLEVASFIRRFDSHGVER